jgi:hypothetical protein
MVSAEPAAQVLTQIDPDADDCVIGRDVENMRMCVVAAVVSTVEQLVAAKSADFTLIHRKKFSSLKGSLGSHSFPVKMDLIYELANYIGLLFMSMKDSHQKHSKGDSEHAVIGSSADTLSITQPVFAVRKFVKGIPGFVDGKLFRDSDVDIIVKKVCGRVPNANIQDFSKLLVFCGQKRFSRADSLQDMMSRFVADLV